MPNEIQAIEKQLKLASRKFSSIRASDNLRAAQEIGFFMAHLQRNPALTKCTPESLQDAFLQGAAFGLSWNPVLQHIYLIPRKLNRNDRNSPVIAYPSPSYRGLLARAEASGAILFFHADVVYARDVFRYQGSRTEPLHEYDVMRPRGDIVGAYAFIRQMDHSYKVEWMSRQQIEEVRKRSEFPNSLMWKNFYEEGCKKAVIRRAWKTWPLRLQEALAPMMETMNTYEGIVKEDGQAEVVIDQEQVTMLRSMLTARGLEQEMADKWIHRAAQIEGVAKIEDLPIGRFEDVRSLLAAKLDTIPPKEEQNELTENH